MEIAKKMFNILISIAKANSVLIEDSDFDPISTVNDVPGP